MSGDPRCLVCRGSGLVHDPYANRDEKCACTDHPPRDVHAPAKAGWVGEALEDVLLRQAERQAAFAAHAESCTAAECVRCGRYVCRKCGGKSGPTRQCRPCWQLDRNDGLVRSVRANIPKRFHWAFDATSERLLGRVKASGELIARGLSNPPCADVAFLGDTGDGKTSLAIAMLDALVRKDPERHASALFVETYWLAGARARFPLGQGEPPAVLAAMEASLLLVDDLGSEIDDRRNVLADVIYHRHNEELPTWITTGFTFEQLMSRYGVAVMRRIFEHGKRVTLGAKP